MPRATGARSRSSAGFPRDPRQGRRARYNRGMAILSAQHEQEVKRELDKIRGPAKLVVFASELGDETNSQTVGLARELGALSDQLTVEILNPYIDRERAAAY